MDVSGICVNGNCWVVTVTKMQKNGRNKSHFSRDSLYGVQSRAIKQKKYLSRFRLQASISLSLEPECLGV